MDRRAGLKLALLGAAAAAGYAALLRPYLMTWGATAEEARRPLPGPDLIPGAQPAATHAITINAPAAEVWPWLVQMGCGRAGWYSYDWLDNGGVPSADRILPEFQKLQVGDVIPSTVDRAIGMKVLALEPERLLVLGAPLKYTLHGVEQPLDRPLTAADQPYNIGYWAFVLEQPAPQTTRLIARTGGVEHPAWLFWLLDRLFWDPAHFIMERRMLLNLKARAEATAAETAGWPVAHQHDGAAGVGVNSRSAHLAKEVTL